MSERKPDVAYEDFVKLDLRVARVLEVREHPNADKLLCLTIDLGAAQRQIIAGLKPYYTPESLLGKQIVVVANLEPRKVRGLESHGMLLAAVCDEQGSRDVVIITPDSEVPPGAEVS